MIRSMLVATTLVLLPACAADPLNILWLHSLVTTGHHVAIGPGWMPHWPYEILEDCRLEGERHTLEPTYVEYDCRLESAPPPEGVGEIVRRFQDG